MLAKNIKYIYDTYNHTSYSSACMSYLISDEKDIVWMLVNEVERKEAKVALDKIAEDLHLYKRRHNCIRVYYCGNSLIEFDNALKKAFKLKGEKYVNGNHV